MRRPMSQLIRNLFSAREEERLLKGALGCAIPEFIARFGAADAVKRVELELRRARRARSRRTLRVLERRPGANRDAHEREFNPEASRRARTVRSRRAASVPRRRSIARAGVFVSTVTRAGAGFQPSPARSSQASAPTARHSAASRPKTCATPAAPAAKSRMRRATDRLRDSFSSSPYFQAGWLVTAQKARTFEVVRRSVPPDCGAEMFVDDQHRASRSPCHGGRRFAAIDTHPLHGR